MFNVNLFAQIKFSEDSALLIKPILNLREVLFYEISNSKKIKGEIFASAIFKSKTLISIELVDTVDGYWLKYKVHNVQSGNKKFLSEGVLDSLTQGAVLYFRMNKFRWYLDSASHTNMKNRIVRNIDSILANRHFQISDSLALVNTKNTLKELSGLETFIRPLIAFNDIYYRKTFWKKWKFYNGYETNMQGNLGVQGFLEQQIVKLSPEKNFAVLSIKFTANKYEAAAVMSPLFKESLKIIDKNAQVFIPDVMTKKTSYKYTIDFKRAIPTDIKIKYFSKFVAKIKNEFEMILIN